MIGKHEKALYKYNCDHEGLGSRRRERGGRKEKLHPQTNDRETSTKQNRDGNGQNVSWNYSYIFYVMKSIGCKSRARETAETDGIETSIAVERECRGRKGNIDMLLTLVM